MTYPPSDRLRAAIRDNRLLVNDVPCSCTWSDPVGAAHPLVGQAFMAVGTDGHVIVSGVVTTVEPTDKGFELGLAHHPA